MIIIAVLVIIIAVLAVGILMSGNFTQQADSNVITISSEDPSMSGKLTIIEWSGVEANADGKYNITQFITKYGGLVGTSNDIVIENGKGEYTLHNNTEFFMVASYIDNIKPDYNKSDVTVNVEYLHNGESILTSSNTVTIFEECPISFGLRMYSVNGTPLSDNDVNIDIPELKNALDNMQV